MVSKSARAAFLALSLGCGAVSTPALSAEKLYTSADPAVLLELAKKYGYAEMSKDSGTAPMIQGAIDGNGYIVKFFCSDKDAKGNQTCNSIQFNLTVIKDIKIEALNDFNNNNRWVKANVFYDGNTPRTAYTIFTMDVYFWGGVTLKNNAIYFETWKRTLPIIKQVIDTGAASN